METSTTSEAARPADLAHDLFARGGETGALCRQMDWAATPLGSVEGWPAELRWAVRTCLESPFPINLWCGPSLVLVYNDAYRAVMGAKHPAGLGRPGAEVWREIWSDIQPMFADIAAGGPPRYQDDAPFVVQRAGDPVDPHAGPNAWYTFALSPVRDASGGIVAYLNVVSETTGRIQAERATEAALRAAERAERRLREMFVQAPAFMALLRGPEHVFEFANDAYYRVVGRRMLVGLPVGDALPEVVEQGFVQLLDGVLNTGEPFVGREMKIFLAREDDAAPEERYVDFVYLPFTGPEDRREGIIVHGYDVTDQVMARREIERLLAESEEARHASERTSELLAEQQVELEITNEQLQETAAELEAQTEALDDANAALRAGEARLRDVFEQAPIPVAVMNGPDHVYTIVSPLYATFGGGRQLLGLPYREAFPEVAPQGLSDVLDRVYRTGEPFFQRERPVALDRDGDGVLEPYVFDLGYQPLRDAEGQVYGVASIAIDVTDAVRARQALEEARAAAEEANRAKSEFLANMSHELRTPLNAIGGYVELMELGIHGPLTVPQTEALRRVQASQRHLLGLINDILSYARLEAGRVEFDLQPLYAQEVMGGLDALIEPQARAKGIVYAVEPCDPDIRLVGDAERVRQVLLNLLSNAVKFTDAGGRVSLRCDAEGGWAHLRVEDNGRGIAREKQEAVFDPFTQVDRRLDQPQEGVGLGLAISRDLARGMGGDLTVESEQGRGSTFTLRLPLANA